MRARGEPDSLANIHRGALELGADLSYTVMHEMVSAKVKKGKTFSNGRLAGLIDWLAIVDRTRNLAWGEDGSKTPGHWEHPSEIIETAAKSFAVDKWAGQENRVEVWI